MVRGFSGFGSALIYIPLTAAVYDPLTAAVTFVMIDFATGVSFVMGAWRQTRWSEVLPLAAAAIASAQFGTLILQYADPVLLRWMICALVALIVGVLVSGWRYRGQAASRRHHRGRIIRRRARRRGADFRPADRDLLARQHARRRRSCAPA